jgi:hypothetical protein
MNQVTTAQPREAASSHLSQAERLDEEATRLALAISSTMIQIGWVSAERLAMAIQSAENIAANGLDRAIGELDRAVAPACGADLKTELAMLVGCFPNSGKNDLRVFGKMLLEDVAAQRPSVAALSLACRRLRRTARFVPTISEVLEAIRAAEVDVMLRVNTIGQLKLWLERARAALPHIQERERIEEEDMQRRHQAYLAEGAKELAENRPF